MRTVLKDILHLESEWSVKMLGHNFHSVTLSKDLKLNINIAK